MNSSGWDTLIAVSFMVLIGWLAYWHRQSIQIHTQNESEPKTKDPTPATSPWTYEKTTRTTTITSPSTPENKTAEESTTTTTETKANEKS